MGAYGVISKFVFWYSSSIIFSMDLSKKHILALFATLLLSLLAYTATQDQPLTRVQRLLNSYITTSTRTTGVNTFCSDLTRTTLIDPELASQYSVYNAQMNSFFSLDGNTFIVNLLNGDTGAAQSEASADTTSAAFFIGPFIVGLAAIVLLSPFLLCCCACPSSCPPSCCRKNQDEKYTQCELYWPVGVLVAALLLCIGACIAGFSQSQNIPKSLVSVSCATSIIFDDIINGNVTQDASSFFLGLNQLNTQLGNLNGNITSINTSMSNLQTGSANMTSVLTAGDLALNNTAKIPANANSGGNMAAITYNTPLNSASPTGTITSNFPAALGSSTTGGLVGNVYTTITGVISSITTISTAASSFVSEVSNFQSAVASLQTTVQNFTTYMTDLDNSLFSTLQVIDQRHGDIHLGVRLVYGLTIAVASMMLLGALLVAFCDKIQCRYLIYISCTILLFIGMVGFFLSVVFSLMVPTIHFGCQFMSNSLASSSNFDANFGNLISDSTIRGYVSTCLPSSTGDLVTALGGNAVNALNNLSLSLTNVNSFNTTEQSNLIQTNLSAMTTAINNYQNGVTNDISDASSVAIISQLSNASAYSGCTTASFSTDSWIPSTQQSPVYTACQISGGSNATSTQCGGANFAGASGGCSGCMDTTSILNTATYSTRANVLTALGNRYTAGGCSTFNTEMANTWDSYYLVKSNAFSPVTGRVTTATTSINQFSTKITSTLSATFTNAVNTMNAAAQNVTDPKFGLVAGLNCRLIGEDFTAFTDTFCQSFFVVSYFARLAVGCASFGILFSMCFGVCTGVRFYKHAIRKLNCVENVGLEEDEVHDITNTNFVKPKLLE